MHISQMDVVGICTAVVARAQDTVRDELALTQTTKYMWGISWQTGNPKNQFLCYSPKGLTLCSSVYLIAFTSELCQKEYILCVCVFARIISCIQPISLCPQKEKGQFPEDDPEKLPIHSELLLYSSLVVLVFVFFLAPLSQLNCIFVILLSFC